MSYITKITVKTIPLFPNVKIEAVECSDQMIWKDFLSSQGVNYGDNARNYIVKTKMGFCSLYDKVQFICDCYIRKSRILVHLKEGGEKYNMKSFNKRMPSLNLSGTCKDSLNYADSILNSCSSYPGSPFMDEMSMSQSSQFGNQYFPSPMSPNPYNTSNPPNFRNMIFRTGGFGSPRMGSPIHIPNYPNNNMNMNFVTPMSPNYSQSLPRHINANQIYQSPYKSPIRTIVQHHPVPISIVHGSPRMNDLAAANQLLNLGQPTQFQYQNTPDKLEWDSSGSLPRRTPGATLNLIKPNNPISTTRQKNQHHPSTPSTMLGVGSGSAPFSQIKVTNVERPPPPPTPGSSLFLTTQAPTSKSLGKRQRGLQKSLATAAPTASSLFFEIESTVQPPTLSSEAERPSLDSPSFRNTQQPPTLKPSVKRVPPKSTPLSLFVDIPAPASKAKRPKLPPKCTAAPTASSLFFDIAYPTRPPVIISELERPPLPITPGSTLFLNKQASVSKPTTKRQRVAPKSNDAACTSSLFISKPAPKNSTKQDSPKSDVSSPSPPLIDLATPDPSPPLTSERPPLPLTPGSTLFPFNTSLQLEPECSFTDETSGIAPFPSINNSSESGSLQSPKSKSPSAVWIDFGIGSPYIDYSGPPPTPRMSAPNPITPPPLDLSETENILQSLLEEPQRSKLGESVNNAGQSAIAEFGNILDVLSSLPDPCEPVRTENILEQQESQRCISESLEEFLARYPVGPVTTSTDFDKYLFPTTTVTAPTTSYQDFRICTGLSTPSTSTHNNPYPTSAVINDFYLPLPAITPTNLLNIDVPAIPSTPNCTFYSPVGFDFGASGNNSFDSEISILGSQSFKTPDIPVATSSFRCNSGPQFQNPFYSHYPIPQSTSQPQLTNQSHHNTVFYPNHVNMFPVPIPVEKNLRCFSMSSDPFFKL